MSWWCAGRCSTSLSAASAWGKQRAVHAALTAWLCCICALTPFPRTSLLRAPATGCREGHTYCRECLSESLNRQPDRCPGCRGQVNAARLTRIRPLENMIDRLVLLRCMHNSSSSSSSAGERGQGGDQGAGRARKVRRMSGVKDAEEQEQRGCQWTGSASALVRHIATECAWHTCVCPHCAYTGARPDVAQHALACPHKIINLSVKAQVSEWDDASALPKRCRRPCPDWRSHSPTHPRKHTPPHTHTQHTHANTHTHSHTPTRTHTHTSMAPAAPHGKPRCCPAARSWRGAQAYRGGAGRTAPGGARGRPWAPRGAPRHAGHARPRACTPEGPCRPRWRRRRGVALRHPHTYTHIHTAPM